MRPKVGNGGAWSRDLAVVLGLPRAAKQAVMVGFDALGLPLALLIASAIKSESVLTGVNQHPLLYLGVVAASVPVFIRLGLYRSVVRFIGPRAAKAILAGVTASAFALALMAAALAEDPAPLSLVFLYWVLALLWVAGSRFVARWLLIPSRLGGEPVVIYGAGEAEAHLAVSGDGDRR